MDFAEAVRALLSAGSTAERTEVPKLAAAKGDDSGRRLLDALVAAHPALRSEVWAALLQGLVNATATSKLARKAAAELTYALRLLAAVLAQDGASRLPALVAHARGLLWALAGILARVHGPLDAAGYPASANSAEEGGPLPAILAGLVEGADEEEAAAVAAAAMADDATDGEDDDDADGSLSAGLGGVNTHGRTGVAARMLSRLEDVVALASAALRLVVALPSPTAAALAEGEGSGGASPLLGLATSALTILRDVAGGSAYAGNKKLLPLLLAPGGAVGSAAVKAKTAGTGMVPAAAAAAPALVQCLSASLLELLVASRDAALAAAAPSGSLAASQAARLASVVDDCLSTLLFAPATVAHYPSAFSRALVYAQQAVCMPAAPSSSLAAAEAAGSPPPAKKAKLAAPAGSSAGTFYVPSILAAERKLFDALAGAGCTAGGEAGSAIQASTLRSLPALLAQFCGGWRRAEALAAGVAAEAGAVAAPAPGGETEAAGARGKAAPAGPAPPPGVTETAMTAAQTMVKAPEFGFFVELLTVATGAALPPAAAAAEDDAAAEGKDAAPLVTSPDAAPRAEPVALVTTRLRATGALVSLMLEAELYSVHADPAPHPRTKVLERAAAWALQAGEAALRPAAAAGPAALSDLLWAWTGALAALQEAHHATIHAALPGLLQALVTAAGGVADAAARAPLLGAVMRMLLQSISVCSRLRQLDVFLGAVFEVGQRFLASDASSSAAAAAALYRAALASPQLLRALGAALRSLPPGQVDAINSQLTDNLAAVAGKLAAGAPAAAAATPSDKKATGGKRPRSDSVASGTTAAAADVAFVAALLVTEALRQYRATAATATAGVKTAAAAVAAGGAPLLAAGLSKAGTPAGALLLAGACELATAAADATVSCAAYDAVRAKAPTLLATLTTPAIAATAFAWPVAQYGSALGGAKAVASGDELSGLLAALPSLAAAAAGSEESLPWLALTSACSFLEARLRLLNTCLCAPPILRAGVAKSFAEGPHKGQDAFASMAAAASKVAAALLASAPAHMLSTCIDVVAAYAPQPAVAAWTEALLRTSGTAASRALLGSLRLYELAPITAAFSGAANKLVADAVAAAGAAGGAVTPSSSKKASKAGTPAAASGKSAPQPVLTALAALAALPLHALIASCAANAAVPLSSLVGPVVTTLAPAAGLPAAARLAALHWCAGIAAAAPAAVAAALPAGASSLMSCATTLLASVPAKDAPSCEAAEVAVKSLLRAALLTGGAAGEAAVGLLGSSKGALRRLGVCALAEALAAAPLPCPTHLASAATSVLDAGLDAAEVVPRLRLALEAAAVSAAGGAGALKAKAVARHLDAAAAAAASALQSATASSVASGCEELAQLCGALQATRAGRQAAAEAIEGASAAPDAAATAAATAAASAARSVCAKLFPADASAPWVTCVLRSGGTSLSAAVASLLPLSALVKGLLPALGVAGTKVSGVSIEVVAQLTRTVVATAAEAVYARAVHEVAPGAGASNGSGGGLMSLEALEAVLSAAPKVTGAGDASEGAPDAALVCEGTPAVRPVLTVLADALLPALCAAAAAPGAATRQETVLALHAVRELVSHPRVLGVGFDRANAVVTALAPLAAAVTALPQRPTAVLTGMQAAAGVAPAAPRKAGTAAFASTDIDVGAAPQCASRVVAAAASAAAPAVAAGAAVSAAPAARLATPASDCFLITAAAWVLHALVKYHPESALACMPAVVAHAQALFTLAMTPVAPSPANGREADGFLPTTTNSILVRLAEQLARHVKTARHYAVHVLVTFMGAAGRRDAAGRPLFAGRGEEELLPAAFALFSACKSDEMQQLFILLAKRPTLQALLRAYHAQYAEGRYTGKA